MPELGAPEPGPGRPPQLEEGLERAKKRPEEFSKNKATRALLKIAERALHVSDKDVEAYVPTELDLQIAEALLTGHLTFKNIAKCVEVSEGVISQRLKHPIVAAWVSRTVHDSIRHRLGLVDASMLNAALGGNVAAAKLILDRYGQLVNRNVNVNVSGTDFDRFTDQDLDAFIRDKKKEVIDVESEEGPDGA